MELDRERFRQWLASKEPDEVVGLVRDAHRCPGATWLQECGQRMSITYSHSLLGTFAKALDEALDPDGEDYRSVTAKEALTVLDEVP